jgi:hypothetical protein
MAINAGAHEILAAAFADPVPEVRFHWPGAEGGPAIGWQRQIFSACGRDFSTFCMSNGPHSSRASVPPDWAILDRAHPNPHPVALAMHWYGPGSGPGVRRVRPGDARRVAGTDDGGPGRGDVLRHGPVRPGDGQLPVCPQGWSVLLVVAMATRGVTRDV